MPGNPVITMARRKRRKERIMIVIRWCKAISWVQRSSLADPWMSNLGIGGRNEFSFGKLDANSWLVVFWDTFLCPALLPRGKKRFRIFGFWSLLHGKTKSYLHGSPLNPLTIILCLCMCICSFNTCLIQCPLGSKLDARCADRMTNKMPSVSLEVYSPEAERS